jgi:hypothetical protein
MSKPRKEKPKTLTVRVEPVEFDAIIKDYQEKAKKAEWPISFNSYLRKKILG